MVGDLDVGVADRDVAELAGRSRRERVEAVIEHAGWRKADASDVKLLDDWLLGRAMEHDKPQIDDVVSLEKVFGQSTKQTVPRRELFQ